MRVFVAILLTVLMSAAAMADNTLTQRLKLKPQPARAVQADTLRGAELDSILLNGYDKPLRGSRETIFATNGLPDEITALGLQITYLDMTGRILHERTVTVRAIIPADATRMLRFPTWDVNRSFFYALGPEPRTSGVTPYTIRTRILWVTKNIER